jgi:hypothetical protein
MFTTAIPQGVPIACTIAVNATQYRITRIRDGSYHVFALGVPWSTSPPELVLCESALRAGGVPIDVRNGRASGPADLMLREPTPFDPPLLVTLPALLARRAPVRAGAHGRDRHLALSV